MPSNLAAHHANQASHVARAYRRSPEEARDTLAKMLVSPAVQGLLAGIKRNEAWAIQAALRITKFEIPQAQIAAVLLQTAGVASETELLQRVEQSRALEKASNVSPEEALWEGVELVRQCLVGLEHLRERVLARLSSGAEVVEPERNGHPTEGA